MTEVTDLEAVWQLADLRGEQLQQALAERDQARGEAHRNWCTVSTQTQHISMRDAIIRERDQELARLRAELAALESFARDRSALVAERDEARMLLAAAREDDDWDPGAMVMLYDSAIAARDEARAKVERLQHAMIWRGDRCRSCAGKNEHRMSCLRHYVGPLEHHWVRSRPNLSMGGTDHDCSCGRSDRTYDGEAPVCPEADKAWRGPVADQEVTP